MNELKPIGPIARRILLDKARAQLDDLIKRIELDPSIKSASTRIEIQTTIASLDALRGYLHGLVAPHRKDKP